MTVSDSDFVPERCREHLHPGMDLRLVEPFASRHHGVVTLHTALRVGISERTWERAHERGTVERMWPGVSRIVGSMPGRAQTLTGIVLAVGPNALVSHRTAAELWGIPRPDGDPVDVISPQRERHASMDGICVHRPVDRRDLRPVLRHGIPATNVLRTLCDLGAVDRRAVHDAVGHVLSTRLATLAAIDQAVARHSRRGRSGIGVLRQAIQAWTLDGKPADSMLELQMRSLFRRFKLPPFVFHPIVEGYEVDFQIAGSAILIECDGWSTHGLDRSRFHRDRERDAVHTNAGYVTLRFTYRHIVTEPRRTATTIRRAVTRWAPELVVAL